MNIWSDGYGGFLGQGVDSSITSYTNEGFAPTYGTIHGERANTMHVGGHGTAHNNMGPYKVVYIFARTA